MHDNRTAYLYDRATGQHVEVPRRGAALEATRRNMGAPTTRWVVALDHDALQRARQRVRAAPVPPTASERASAAVEAATLSLEDAYGVCLLDRVQHLRAHGRMARALLDGALAHLSDGALHDYALGLLEPAYQEGAASWSAA